MPVILALETATTVASAALLEDDRLVGEIFVNTTKNHSRTLMPLIDNLLGSAEMKVEDVDGYAVAIGPGSFTGLRIGLATVKGMAQVMGAPLFGIPTLDALARNLLGVRGLVCPVLDARKEEVYTAVFRTGGGNLERLTGYMALSAGKLVEILAGYGERVTLLGDAVASYRERYFSKSFINIAPAADRWPRAAQVAELAMERMQAGDSDDLFALSPLYVRRAEAEVRMEEKLSECGAKQDAGN